MTGLSLLGNPDSQMTTEAIEEVCDMQIILQIINIK
jgi:hypothetical protein